MESKFQKYELFIQKDDLINITCRQNLHHKNQIIYFLKFKGIFKAL